jgi:small subunit ribosomal protein S18
MAFQRKKGSRNRRPMKKRANRINLADIDYKNIRMLQQFVSDRGKIVPRRVTNVSAGSQRALSLAIRRARQIALIPFSHHD